MSQLVEITEYRLVQSGTKWYRASELSLVEESLVVGEDLLTGDVKTELQGYKDGKL